MHSLLSVAEVMTHIHTCRTVIAEQRIWLEILEQTLLGNAKLTSCLVPKILNDSMKNVDMVTQIS